MFQIPWKWTLFVVYAPFYIQRSGGPRGRPSRRCRPHLTAGEGGARADRLLPRADGHDREGHLPGSLSLSPPLAGLKTPNQGALSAPLQGGCHSCSVRLRWPQRASSEDPSGSSGGSSGHPSWVGGGGSVHELSPQPVLGAPSAPALLTTSVTHPPSPPHPGASACTVGPQCSLVVLK